MQFDSLAAALAMDGHGGYVWSIVLVSIIVTAGLLLAPVLRSRRFMREQRGVLRREQAQAAASTQVIEEADAPSP